MGGHDAEGSSRSREAHADVLPAACIIFDDEEMLLVSEDLAGTGGVSDAHFCERRGGSSCHDVFAHSRSFNNDEWTCFVAGSDQDLLHEPGVSEHLTVSARSPQQIQASEVLELVGSCAAKIKSERSSEKLRLVHTKCQEIKKILDG